MEVWGESGLADNLEPVCTVKGRNISRLAANSSGLYGIDEKGQIVVISLDLRKSVRVVESKEKIVALHAGHGHLIALSENGTVLTGSVNKLGNTCGQLGRGFTDSTNRTREHMKGPDLRSIILGWPRSDTITGRQVDGGEATSEDGLALFDDIRMEPVDARWLEGRRPVQIASGDYHCLVRTECGKVYGFGSNEMLQLGIGPYDPQRTISPFPQQILALGKDESVSFIAAAAQTSYFVVDSPANTCVMAAGFGQFGQLGNKTWTHAEGNPTRVHSVSELKYFDE